MKGNRKPTEIVITGVGITSAIGQGQAAFSQNLLEGKHAFRVMQREGRQLPSTASVDNTKSNGSAFLGAEIQSLSIPDFLPKKVLRTSSFSAQVALTSLYEAWQDAKLNDVSADRIGLVIGGSNFQQRELVQTYESYRDRRYFLKPSYGHTFMDSDVCGLCTELYGIHGLAYTLGGASASGQLAVLHAIDAVQSGKVDVCIAMGALMDLSCWELQAFRSMGAMGSDRYAEEPGSACRPFDQQRDGFIFGEACGVVVIENALSIQRAGLQPYARCIGGAIWMDGNRNPNPSVEGEVRVIEKTLHEARLSAENIDYVNPHGTASIIGDDIELQAINRSELNHAYINTTKSITGHGLSAAGAVEVIATLLQMRNSRLHPSRNLDTPIASSHNWVGRKPISHRINHALNLSMGFGGINTALCLQSL